MNAVKLMNLHGYYRVTFLDCIVQKEDKEGSFLIGPSSVNGTLLKLSGIMHGYDGETVSVIADEITTEYLLSDFDIKDIEFLGNSVSYNDIKGQLIKMKRMNK